jgi:hypothetical protein
MWDQLFPTYLSEFPAADDKRYTAITVTVDRVTEDLQNNYGFGIQDERCSEIPPENVGQEGSRTAGSVRLRFTRRRQHVYDPIQDSAG